MNSVEALIELAKDRGFPTVLADRNLASRKDPAVVPIGSPWIKRSGALLWDAHRYQTAAGRAFMAGGSPAHVLCISAVTIASTRRSGRSRSFRSAIPGFGIGP
jgi:hypothetical protein